MKKKNINSMPRSSDRTNYRRLCILLVRKKNPMKIKWNSFAKQPENLNYWKSQKKKNQNKLQIVEWIKLLSLDHSSYSERERESNCHCNRTFTPRTRKTDNNKKIQYENYATKKKFIIHKSYRFQVFLVSRVFSTFPFFHSKKHQIFF